MSRNNVAQGTVTPYQDKQFIKLIFPYIAQGSLTKQLLSYSIKKNKGENYGANR